MGTLPTELRRKLEAAIGRETDSGGARAIAEGAASAALLRLDVDRPEPRGHLTDADRKLRVKLRARARARQLGDRLRSGQQGIDRLVEACAYEHWHRMLFARFLAENELLWHPDGYSVTIADCTEFAAEEGVDTWEIAGRYASRVLPQIFRPDDPLLAVRLAPEHQKALREILKSLAPEIFTASDSLGWVYQFWQARRKKQVNDSEVKIGADELPAVTQLFTEPYMVDFLLQNTLGAWWTGAGRELPMPMPYLRTLDDGSPAAGRFEGWPRTAAELKVLDPCCGSGHFLVAAFHMLVTFRMAEGLSANAACDAVLRDNLHGLELDNRCVQIAAFALAMAAWTYPDAGGYRVLAGMNVACSGLSVAPMQLPDETAEEAARREIETRKIRDRWVRAGRDVRQQRGMGRMFDLFVDAPVLGSLIDPTRDMPESLLCAPADELRPVLERVLGEEGNHEGTKDTKEDEDEAERHEGYVAARGIAEAARLLSTTYSLVVTNVPYLNRTKHGPTLAQLCASTFPKAKAELATVMIERGLQQLGPGGCIATVAPQNWLFRSRYTAFRQQVLTERSVVAVVRLGEHAFTSPQAAGAFACMVLIRREAPIHGSSTMLLDASPADAPDRKSEAVRNAALASYTQDALLRNPDHRIVDAGQAGQRAMLSEVAEGLHGQGSFDSPCFVQTFWERARLDEGWVRQQSSVTQTGLDGGATNIFRWEEGKGMLASLMEAKRQEGYASGKWRAGVQAWGLGGVLVSQMRGLCVTPYRGVSFDDNCAVILPKDQRHTGAIWAFCASSDFHEEVRRIDQKLNVTNATLVKVPFDLPHWQKIAAEKYPNGLPEPYSEDPTQWLFKGTVTPSDAPLQVAVARLLGYRWPDQAPPSLCASVPLCETPPDPLDALADDDGIVCIPPAAGELPAAERLRDLLRAAYGPSWSAGREQTLLTSVGYANRSLDDWLRNSFFEQHCKLFHHRPFRWQVWDGHKEGFSALVNYHRLDHKLLESLAFRYLGDWIARQRDADKRGEAGAAERLRKAEDLQRRLKLVLEGEAPHDIFVRWKAKKEQPIGWHPDLNDGVRLNIRPFIQAGVLRWTPNIKWGKDRGKNPPGAPFGEDRDNDTHLALADKSAAREK